MAQFCEEEQTEQVAGADVETPPVQPIRREVTIHIEFYCPILLAKRLDTYRGEKSRTDALRELLETYLPS